MSQPVSNGGQYSTTLGTGAGTAVISSSACDLHRLVWGGSYVGTIVIHDAHSTDGTSASSGLVTLGIPLLRYPYSLELGIHCKNGIVYEATGTPTMTLVWDK